MTVGEGGLVMDSNGNKGSLVANLQGPGTVTKAGRGTLTVSCNQTGTGPLICQAGGMDIGCNSVARPITVKEVAFLLDAAPGAVTNGVTPLKIVELGVTNRLVSESGDYGLVAQRMLGYTGDYMSFWRVVLASDVTELTQRSLYGYQGDICNGYLALCIGLDLSGPREGWLALAWFFEIVDGQVVLEFPELFLEKYREIVARDTGEPCDSLFFSVFALHGRGWSDIITALKQKQEEKGHNNE